MKKLFTLISFLIITPLFLLADDDTYSTRQRLFHVERSKNKNIVCYDVKTATGSTLDKSNPVDVYWVNREEKVGEKNGLSALQRRLAFGYKIISKGESSASIALNACPDREMKIEQNGQKFQCLININKQKAVLQKIYVKTKSNSSIKVEYVELIGTALDSGELINEKIYN